MAVVFFTFFVRTWREYTGSVPQRLELLIEMQDMLVDSTRIAEVERRDEEYFQRTLPREAVPPRKRLDSRVRMASRTGKQGPLPLRRDTSSIAAIGGPPSVDRNARVGCWASTAAIIAASGALCPRVNAAYNVPA